MQSTSLSEEEEQGEEDEEEEGRGKKRKNTQRKKRTVGWMKGRRDERGAHYATFRGLR